MTNFIRFCRYMFMSYMAYKIACRQSGKGFVTQINGGVPNVMVVCCLDRSAWELREWIEEFCETTPVE